VCAWAISLRHWPARVDCVDGRSIDGRAEHAVDDGWSGFRVHNDALMMRRARHLLATAPQSCCAGGHQLWGGGGGSPGRYHLGAVIATIKIPGFDWNSPTLDLAISAANTIKLLA
jgi:hypothetical protein